MIKPKIYEEEIKILKLHAEQKAKEIEGDLRVYIQVTHGYYVEVVEILEETINKLETLLRNAPN
jgi:hypothetical protein